MISMPIMCSAVCLDQILQKVEHVTSIKCMEQFNYRQELIVSS